MFSSQINAVAAGSAHLCDEGEEVSLRSLIWDYRIVVITSSDASADLYQVQQAGLLAEQDGLRDRNIIIISLFDSGCSLIDGRPLSSGSAQEMLSRLGADSTTFSVRLIGKDGGVKLNQTDLLDADVLFGIIDQMPMRRREMQRSREGG
jgi:hypothetical protein